MRSMFGSRALQPRIMLTREPELAPLARSDLEQLQQRQAGFPGERGYDGEGEQAGGEDAEKRTLDTHTGTTPQGVEEGQAAGCCATSGSSKTRS